MTPIKNTRKDLNIALLGFFFIFFFIPFLENRSISFSATSFIFSFVLMMSVRILPLSAKHAWSFIVLSVLACCFDLLLMITFHPLLGLLLAVLAYGIYVFCFGAYIWILTKNLSSPDHSPGSLVKSGLCGYFLLGFFWMAIYAFLSILDPMVFSEVSAGNIPFFYLSFLSLSLLAIHGSFAVYPPPMQYLISLEAITGQLFLFFLIVRLAILSYSYEARR